MTTQRPRASRKQVEELTDELAATKKVARGHAATSKGLKFEQEANAYFSRLGWHVEPNVKFRNFQIDLQGEKSDWLGGKSYLLVECKGNTERCASIHP